MWKLLEWVRKGSVNLFECFQIQTLYSKTLGLSTVLTSLFHKIRVEGLWPSVMHLKESKNARQAFFLWQHTWIQRYRDSHLSSSLIISIHLLPQREDTICAKRKWARKPCFPYATSNCLPPSSRSLGGSLFFRASWK